MNVLLVGLGRWGEKHLRVLRQLGATVWVADVAATRRAVGDRAGRRRPPRGRRFPRGAAARRGRGRRHAGRQPSSHRRDVPGRRPPLLHREAAHRICRRRAGGGGGGAGGEPRRAGRPHLSIPPGHRDAAGRPGRQPDRRRALCDRPLLRLQAPAQRRRRHPHRRHPLLRPLRLPARPRGDQCRGAPA